MKLGDMRVGDVFLNELTNHKDAVFLVIHTELGAPNEEGHSTMRYQWINLYTGCADFISEEEDSRDILHCWTVVRDGEVIVEGVNHAEEAGA